MVASWGAVVSCPGMRTASVSSSLIGSLRVLLGLDTELPHGASKDPSPVADWELNRLKLRSFVDFSMNAISSVRAIHTLIEHIDNVVINEEVPCSLLLKYLMTFTCRQNNSFPYATASFFCSLKSR